MILGGFLTGACSLSEESEEAGEAFQDGYPDIHSCGYELIWKLGGLLDSTRGLLSLGDKNQNRGPRK
jgi:hypothetical protein